MSILAENTEKRAIKELAKVLKHFGRLDPFGMSAQDTYDSRQAEHLIRAVIESNGYRVLYRKGKGTRIYKQKRITI
jgi:hypothetical protein